MNPAAISAPQYMVATAGRLMIRWATIVCGVGFLGFLLACGQDSTPTVTIDPRTTLWAMRLDQHAATMALIAPYDTLQVRATALSIDGTRLDGIGTIRFTSIDSNVVVTPTGLVTARFHTGDGFARVAAILPYNNETLTDTIYIQVTDAMAVSQLSTFSIRDYSTRLIYGHYDQPNLVGKGTNTRGDSLRNILTYFEPSDPAVINVVRNGYLGLLRPGKSMIYGETTFYGVRRTDSMAVVVENPSGWFVTVTSRTPVGSTVPIAEFVPQTVIIGPGGSVAWYNIAMPTDIVFDDSTAAEPSACISDICPPTGGGNIPAFVFDSTVASSEYRARRFSRPGVYIYRSLLHGTTGKIIVE